MASFKDDNGRDWSLRLDFAKVRQLRDSLSLDFVNFDGVMSTFARIDADLSLLMATIAALTKAQREAAKIDDEAFESGFSGESFEAARVALEECVVNFSPPRERENLTKALAMQAAMRKELVGKLLAKNMASETGG